MQRGGRRTYTYDVVGPEECLWVCLSQATVVHDEAAQSARDLSQLALIGQVASQ